MQILMSQSPASYMDMFLQVRIPVAISKMQAWLTIYTNTNTCGWQRVVTPT